MDQPMVRHGKDVDGLTLQYSWKGGVGDDGSTRVYHTALHHVDIAA